MKLLFFDCETNGLPVDYRASYTEVEKWPRVISLAWHLADANGSARSQGHYLIKPDGWTVPTEKFWTDKGYNQESSMEFGIPIAEVIDAFIEDKQQADVLVAHNLSFDHRIVWAEIIRAGRTPKSGMHKICTMLSSTKYCNLPGKKGPKWPKLEELYQVLFGKNYENAHDALSDVLACKESFFELVRRAVIRLDNLEAAA